MTDGYIHSEGCAAYLIGVCVFMCVYNPILASTKRRVIMCSHPNRRTSLPVALVYYCELNGTDSDWLYNVCKA